MNDKEMVILRFQQEEPVILCEMKNIKFPFNKNKYFVLPVSKLRKYFTLSLKLYIICNQTQISVVA